MRAGVNDAVEVEIKIVKFWHRVVFCGAKDQGISLDKQSKQPWHSHVARWLQHCQPPLAFVVSRHDQSENDNGDNDSATLGSATGMRFVTSCKLKLV